MNNEQYPTINLKATGQRIQELRKARGLKVSELSEFMGFTEPQAVYKWQRGESLPTVDNLYALSKILRTSMEDILVGNDEMSSRLLSLNLWFSEILTNLYYPLIAKKNGISKRRVLKWQDGCLVYWRKAAKENGSCP